MIHERASVLRYKHIAVLVNVLPQSLTSKRFTFCPQSAVMFLHVSQGNVRLFPCTALTDCFL